MAGKRERKKRERSRRTHHRELRQKSAGPAGARKLLESTAEESRRLANDFVRGDDLPGTVGELADSARSLALRVIQRSPLVGKHACEPGCAFCCHTAVTVVSPEAFKIAQYLNDHYTDEVLADVGRRLDENAVLASSMTRDEYIARNIRCALLTEDGQCRAHAVRPIACAGFLSTSRAKCEAEFERAANREAVPTDEFAMLAGLGVSHGLKEAFRHAHLDGEFYELHHALRAALDATDGEERWARGEKVLDGCLT